MNFANILDKSRAIRKATRPEMTIAIKIIIKSFEEMVFSKSLTPAAVPVRALFIE